MLTTETESGERKHNLLQLPRGELRQARSDFVVYKSPHDIFSGQLVASAERLSYALEALCDICVCLVAEAPPGDAGKALGWLDAALDDCYRIRHMLDEYQCF